MTSEVATTNADTSVPLGRRLGARLLRFSLRAIPAERHRLFALTIIIGGVCGLIAVLFHSAIAFAEQLWIEPALHAQGKWFVIRTLLVTTLGALVSGAILHFFAPNARGSGIPQVKVAYVVKTGRLRLRDAVYKFFLSALQIGTGSALGREGPTVQICAGVSSALGRLFAISPQNRRRLLPVGAAAGVAAAFNAPIAAVTFITEEIIGDLDQTLLSGVVVAAALAAVIERSLLGSHPIFNVPRDYELQHASSLISYALMGCAAAPFSHLFYTGMLRARAYCKSHGGRLSWAWPAVGGFSTGALALLAFYAVGQHGVTGDGYATLSEALRGNLPLIALLTLACAKLLATSLCYATGGAGGLFAPVLFMGAMLGGSFGQLDRLIFLHNGTQLGAFALVGMGALFAAVIRAPITSVLIIFEMTGSYSLVLPLMIANSAAYVLARKLYPTPIYEALLEQDGIHLPQPGRADV
ncbi:MAG TPA: chloride channel protein, partial [Polyangiales bacterium]